MNIGDYVRTKGGLIGKVIEIKGNSKIYFIPNRQENDAIDIIKSSPDIIDLIEVGDYVNGKLVTTAEDVYTTDNIYIGKEVFVNHDELIIEEDIENIVTHEMFESMKYKIGE